MTFLLKTIAAGAVLAMGVAMPALGAPLSMAITGDTVLSGKCVQANQFKHNDAIVFRARVLDIATGEDMTGDALTSVVAELPNGTSVPLKFGEHPPGQPSQSFWSGVWGVPADFPTGTLGYKIVATNKSGATATYEPFKVVPSQLTIVE